MQVTKDYVRVCLKAGYWETGVLRRFFRADPHDDRNMPASFWSDNCDYDPVANCYRFRLTVLHNGVKEDVQEDVYIPREYVLLVCVQENKTVPRDKLGKIGFQVPDTNDRTEG